MEDYSFGDVVLGTLWFMLVFAWIWLLISILTDVFRDPEVSGWGKAGWTLFLIVFPWLGALVYLVTRGSSMNARHRERARAQDAEVREYVRSAAGAPSPADELGKLAELQRRGILTEAEYARAKSALLEQSQNGAGARR
ncbi:SHOCT domain-containing protein [Dactylosporangium sp. NBC_01737]|uniref:SHOCT domain-containing protein n=1 Tax=Dactylosporangium sp. NBC_01737 TaxID=2975959 RepID=UPI002E10B900|nr:SHOCT domain-containing protein [Dactylosporangium sp. NBC_01737]